MHAMVLSPHRDDAAFSCGLTIHGLLRARSTVTLVNICTISAYAPHLAPGGGETESVTAERGREDDVFLDRLRKQGDSVGQVECVDLAWKDSPLRWHLQDTATLEPLPLRQDETHELCVAFAALAQAAVVLVPDAIGGHVDHRLVKAAARAAFAEASLVFYEDLPYACRVNAAERRLAAGEDAPALYEAWLPVNAGPPGLKRQFALCYPSQIAPELADEMECYAVQQGGRECFHGSREAILKLTSALQVSVNLQP